MDDKLEKELNKTRVFCEKTVKAFGWELNPDDAVNDGIIQGLTRNKLKYGKRFCPCFIVQKDEDGSTSNDNRVCPCVPAREHEVADGCCHCQIFCNSEYAESKR